MDLSYFKDVVGFEDHFMVSPDGQVFSKRSNRLLKRVVSGTGYYTIPSRIGGRKGKCVCIKVHRAVAEAFTPNPTGKPFVNHLDGDKLNNSVNNLEWCTAKENAIHAVETGLANYDSISGESNQIAKLTEKDVMNILSLHVPKKYGKRRISRQLSLPTSAVSGVIEGRTWKHIKRTDRTDT